MASTLIFPDGVKLAEQYQIPGPPEQKLADWKRIQAASITPGFVFHHSEETRFAAYAEINVDAPKVWDVFRDLSQSLLCDTATLVFGDGDEEPISVGSGRTPLLLELLERHKYQLAHDGFIHFGLVGGDDSKFTEVFVEPTKHFRVWLNDERAMRAIMERYGIREGERLEFLDEYPRITTRLPSDRVVYPESQQLFDHLAEQIRQLSP